MSILLLYISYSIDLNSHFHIRDFTCLVMGVFMGIINYSVEYKICEINSGVDRRFKC